MENELLEETGYVGDIPEGWKWVKLGDLVEIIKGKKPENLIENPSKNTLPYLTAEYLRYKTPNQFVDIEKEKKLPVCEKDDIILIWDGSQAGQVFTGSKGILASTMVKIIPNLDIVNKAYLYFFLTTKFEYLNTQTTGSAIPHVNKNAFLNLPIPLPPLPEQKAIADVLSSIDDKIELLHRQNKTLEEMAMTLFRQWFIEPTKDGLPDGWEEVSLGELIEISSGKSIEKAKLKEKGLYPVLGANGEIGRTDNWLYEGELIYTGRVGTLGNVFMVFKNEKVWLTDNTLVIKPKKNEYFYFVYFTLKNAKLDEYNSGSTQPLIRQSDIKKIEIFLPKINSLRDFEIISRNIFTKIQFNKIQIQTLEKLRDTLLPKLINGEIRVKI